MSNDIQQRLPGLLDEIAAATTVSESTVATDTHAAAADAWAQSARSAPGSRSRVLVAAAAVCVVLVGLATIQIIRNEPATDPANGSVPTGTESEFPPGAVIAPGVSLYPVLDDSDVPDIGAGTTYAYMGYFSSGPNLNGTVWTGVAGRTSPNGPIPAAAITVSAPVDAEPLPNLVPGRRPGVEEYRISTPDLPRTELQVAIDGYVVQILGPDIDELYQILDIIRPTTDDTGLTGYTFTGPLPDSVTELARPFEQGPGAGSFPNLFIRNGIVSMSVMPTTPMLLIGQWLEPMEPITINGHSGYFSTSRENGSLHLAVALSDGTTLNVTGHSLTRAEFLHAVSAITLVDEATWTTRYQPRPAVVPTISAVTATTITTDGKNPTIGTHNTSDSIPPDGAVVSTGTVQPGVATPPADSIPRTDASPTIDSAPPTQPGSVPSANDAAPSDSIAPTPTAEGN